MIKLFYVDFYNNYFVRNRKIVLRTWLLVFVYVLLTIQIASKNKVSFTISAFDHFLAKSTTHCLANCTGNHYTLPRVRQGVVWSQLLPINYHAKLLTQNCFALLFPSRSTVVMNGHESMASNACSPRTFRSQSHIKFFEGDVVWWGIFTSNILENSSS